MNPKRKYEDMERSTSDMTDFRRPPYAVQYPKSGYNNTQNMSTAAKMIRAQGEQIKHRPTFRDLLDRIIDGINSGEFMMQDPVPEGFLEDGHIDVTRYIADKYDIRGDADGQKSDLRVRGCESTCKRD